MDTLPPLRALQVFETLGHCASVNEAARRLHITPGAISQQIRLLEAHLNTSLTFKEGKRLRLNEAGLRFHQACTQAFEVLREGQTELERSRNQASLSISALPSFLQGWLNPRIYTWQDRYHPELTLDLHGGHSEPEPDWKGLDFRFTYGTILKNETGHAALFTDCVLPVCSPALLARGPALRHPRDILHFPLLSSNWQPKFSSPPSWSDWFSHNEVATSHLRLDSYRIYSLSHLAIDAAIQGHGFVLAQYAMVETALQQGLLSMPFAQALPLPWPYVLSWRPDAFDTSYCRAFQRWVIRQGQLQQARLDQLLLHPNKALSQHGDQGIHKGINITAV